MTAPRPARADRRAVRRPEAFDGTTSARLESELSGLAGERLRYIGRAVDLVWIGFGEDVEIEERRGGTRIVARRALHLQCPWRISRDSLPLVGSQDVYRSPGSDELDDDAVDRAGGTAFDVAARALTAEAEQLDLRVTSLAADEWGGLRLVLDGGLTLEALPLSTRSTELWRYIVFDEPGHHLVVFDDRD